MRTRRRALVLVGLVAGIAVLVVGLWAFQPWRLWTTRTVDEALPVAAAPAPVPAAVPAPVAPPTPVAPVAPPEPVELGAGDFVAQEHPTSGVARVIELPDGSRYVRLEGFSVTDGPDLQVWVTDQEAGGDWYSYDDGRYLELGGLKGTDGDQNYLLPPGADIAGLSSVVIWCDRFNVAFGSAPVTL